MITVETFVFNPFQENTYLLYDDSKECIIVDPGCYSENEYGILDMFIRDNELKPVKVVITHGHVDHLLGAAYIKATYNVDFEIHKGDQPGLDGVVEHGAVYGFNVEEPPSVTTYLEEGYVVRFGESELKVLHVPGHSPGHIVLFAESEKFILAGDVLFAGSIGRTDLPGGDYETLIENIKAKLLTLSDDVTVFSGHGMTTTIGKEKQNNPFLK